MPTPAQVVNRHPFPAADRHFVGKVTSVGAQMVKVAIDPGGEVTSARPLSGAVYAVDQRVLILLTRQGNYVLGRITP